MGWTAYPSISVWSPILSCIPSGFAILAIFISTYQYLIDAYELHAASALVGVTFVRYIVAAGMIPVSIPFYRNLGVHWTLTVLGAISAVLAPVPFIFWKVRPKIRFCFIKISTDVVFSTVLAFENAVDMPRRGRRGVQILVIRYLGMQ